MPDGMLVTPASTLIPALGLALALCYVAIRRGTAASSNASISGRHKRDRDLMFLLKTRKRQHHKPKQVHEDRSRGGCEGLVDLIRGEAGPEEVGPLMSRKELSTSKLVVVVFGPASTRVYQVRE